MSDSPINKLAETVHEGIENFAKELSEGMATSASDSKDFAQYEDKIRVDERKRVLAAIDDCISEGLLSDELLENLHHFLNVRYNES